MTRRWEFCTALVFVSLTCVSAHAISLGQIDDFQDGTTQNWSHGSPGSPNPPVNVADAGPGGVGDHALLNTSTALGGPGTRMAMLNEMQWTGDYLAEGVSEIAMMLRSDPAAGALNIRVGLEAGFGERYISDAFALPNDGGWYAASFDISPAALIQVGGSATATDVLSAVSELRIFSAAVPDWRGDEIAASLFADNITAVPEPSLFAPGILGGLLLLWRRRSS